MVERLGFMRIFCGVENLEAGTLYLLVFRIVYYINEYSDGLFLEVRTRFLIVQRLFRDSDAMIRLGGAVHKLLFGKEETAGRKT